MIQTCESYQSWRDLEPSERNKVLEELKRVLVGTRKGAFILTSDGKRQKWDVSEPLFTGWEIYHMKGSPADPDRIYAIVDEGERGEIWRFAADGGDRGTARQLTLQPGWCGRLGRPGGRPFCFRPTRPGRAMPPSW